MTGTGRVDSAVAEQALGTAAEPGESIMNADARNAPRWSTSSFGDAPDLSAMEMVSLREHLGRCKRPRGPFFALQGFAETLDEFLAPRFITTVTVATLLIAAAALLL